MSDMGLPERKPNRLRNYDYSTPGAYFITICTQDRKCILSRIEDCAPVGEGFPLPKLTKYGFITERYIQNINKKFPSIFPEKYIIMPNHIHMILRVDSGRGDPSPTVEQAIGWLKYMCTKEINSEWNIIGQKVFQRSFHDHIIRNDGDYSMIWNYIDTNALKWREDCFYTEQ